MKKEKVYRSIVSHYESCFDRYGDTHLGMDWPKLEDVEKRYTVMLDIVLFLRKNSREYSLLDFGCGAGHLLDYLRQKNLTMFNYAGLDISSKFISLCQTKYPGVPFIELDVLEQPDKLACYDLIVMNGVFTEKRELSYEQMFDYFTSMVRVVFSRVGKGMAFNVMSKHVDWERDDLFHLSHDALTEFIVDKVTRNYVIRNDYGLYEYTVYLYK